VRSAWRWGLWATSYWLPENLNDLEVTGARWLHGPVPVPGYLLYTTLVTIVLAVLHAASGRVLHADALRPGRLLCRLSAIAAVLWFAVLVVPRVPFALLVLPVLLGVCVLGLRALRPASGAPSRVLAALGRLVAWRRLLLLAALPIAATAAYATVDLLEPGTETLRRLSGAIVWTQTALGWLAFVAALLTARSHRGDRPAAVVPERHRVPGAGLPGEHP
jgi:hypothetical protein